MKGRTRAVALAAMGTILVLLAACGAGSEEAAGGPDAVSEVRTYQVRGVIQSLPDPETGAGKLRIRHEAIPDLVGQSGEIEPMAAMTMPFPPAAELDLAGFTVGDKVGFVLTVDWEAARPVTLTAMETLPAETELTLE